MRIGVFDSGVGGITVLTELRKHFRFADFVYLGDTANVPYGTKSPAQVERLSASCAARLREQKVDALVVACNTASSLALHAIQEVMGSTPVFGVVEPGIEAALTALMALPSSGLGSPLLVLATRATIQSQAYGQAFRRILAHHRTDDENFVPVYEQACPLLVPMIEEGWVDHAILHQTIAEYVKVYVKQNRPGVALLGCTHYPWILKAFEKALPGWKVVNSASAIAEAVERSEWMQGYLSRLKKGFQESESEGKVSWIFTDKEAIPQFAKQWIG